MNIEEEKEGLRQSVLERRRALSETEWRTKSKAIANHFYKTSEYKSSRFIHSYISMNSRYEVDTRPIIRRMLKEGRRVAVPVMENESGKLRHSEIFNLDALTRHDWGVQEPVKKKWVNDSEFDLILVPLLAADAQGHRLGYGKGFYDRFLTNIQAIKFGLVFEQFIFENIPSEDFDIPLDGLVSESGLRRCNNKNGSS